MKKLHKMHKELILGLIGAIILGILIPAYIVCIQAPATLETLIQDTETEAVLLADTLASVLFGNSSLSPSEGLSPDQSRTLIELKKRLSLYKVRLFAADGTITFSTDPDEVGQVNSRPSFLGEVARGRSYHALIQEETPSLDGQIVTVDIVETFVPAMRGGEFAGAFEIYHDITSRKAYLEAVLDRTAGALALILIGYMLIQFFMAYRIKTIEASRAAAELKADKLAYSDHLTGLPNRTLYMECLTRALARNGPQGEPLAVMFLDLDGFKEINDSLGHAQGDLLLQSVASRLRGCLSHWDTVARTGGDEFLILLPSIQGKADAVEVARKILETLATTHDSNQKELFITTSIGISLYPENGQDAETLVRQADMAMYAVKAAGRKNYRVFDMKMDEEIQGRNELRSSLHQALARNEFSLVYQPQHEFKSGKIVSAEALLRWDHPTKGAISPDLFIPLAEENGLINEIGDWVLSTACAQHQTWREAGLPPVRMAVNISGHQVKQGSLPSRVAKHLAAAGMDARHLELELTESVFMESIKSNIQNLVDLKSLGVSLALDDFGTGYSSLRYLRDFSFDRLKIDRSFVQEIANDGRGETIVDTIIAMGEKLGMRVISEGIETRDQLTYLQNRSCHEGQGYFLGRPMSACALAQRLAGGSETLFKGENSSKGIGFLSPIRVLCSGEGK